ncbi:MAG: hypothetical protein JNL11_10540 [Bdellovibrionaceae bacterium]|nr:hypothetical protein [Pseudobdellovibrionaceae bacterium]
MSFSSLLLFFFLSSPSLSSEKDVYIYINGGAETTFNSPKFETELLALQKVISPGKGKFFSAGGPQIGVPKQILHSDRDVYNNWERDDSGFILLEKSRLPDAVPATKENILGAFKNLAEQNPKTLTVFFTDHGLQTGVCLWPNGNTMCQENESLSATELNKIFKKFPNTQIRVIHSHCFSGATIVDPNRSQPKSLEELPRFLKENYLSNVCAFGTGDENQLTNFWTNGAVPENSKWFKVLTGAKTATIKTLKEDLIDTSTYDYTYPVTTLGYFMRDIGQAFCKHKTKSEPSTCQASSGLSDLEKTCDQLKCNSCGLDLRYAPEIIPNKENEAAVKEWHKLKNEILPNLFLKTNYPERVELYKDIVEREKALALSIDHQSALNSYKSDVYSIRTNGEILKKEFEGFINRHLNAKWVKENRSRFPIFAKLFANRSSGETSYEIIDKLSSHNEKPFDIEEIRKRHKGEGVSKRLLDLRNQACQDIALDYLNLPGNNEIKKLYESIKNCEETPLDQKN